jgi:hypothetical protein
MIAAEDVRKNRTAICLACEHLRKGIVFSCRKCGCPIKSKTAIAGSSCPDGRWGPSGPANNGDAK